MQQYCTSTTSLLHYCCNIYATADYALQCAVHWLCALLTMRIIVHCAVWKHCSRHTASHCLSENTYKMHGRVWYGRVKYGVVRYGGMQRTKKELQRGQSLHYTLTKVQCSELHILLLHILSCITCIQGDYLLVLLKGKSLWNL